MRVIQLYNGDTLLRHWGRWYRAQPTVDAAFEPFTPQGKK